MKIYYCNIVKKYGLPEMYSLTDANDPSKVPNGMVLQISTVESPSLSAIHRLSLASVGAVCEKFYLLWDDGDDRYIYRNVYRIGAYEMPSDAIKIPLDGHVFYWMPATDTEKDLVRQYLSEL